MKFSSKTDPFLRPDLTHLSQTVIRRNLLAICLFQSTHPWRMWRQPVCVIVRIDLISIHTSTKDVTLAAVEEELHLPISIYTSVKDVTNQLNLADDYYYISIHTSMKDVTRHCPRRFDAICHFNPHIHEGCDKNRQPWIFIINYFNPHIRKGCDGLKKNTHICSARSLCGANRFLPNLFLFSSLRLAMLKTLFQRQRSGSVHFIFDCTSHCRESVYIDFDWLRLLTHSRTYELYYIHLFPLL